MAPFQPAIERARQAVDDAQQKMRSAHRRLERAERVKRLAARREAKQAGASLAAARDRFDQARTLAAPAQQKIDAARAAIDSGESSISTFRSLHHWSGHETRRDRLVELHGAISTWRQWAVGGVVEDDELSSAIKTMKTNRDTERQESLAYLASAVTEWAERGHPTLALELRTDPTAISRSFGIEL